jgi:hypothetical protein
MDKKELSVKPIVTNKSDVDASIPNKDATETRLSRRNSLKKLSTIAKKNGIRPRARKRLVATILGNFK